MLRHDDRLSGEEVAAVARLHAERLAAQEAAELAERERIASTTAPEELATMLGTSADEVRALSAEVRRRPLTDRPAQSVQWQEEIRRWGRTSAPWKVLCGVAMLAGIVAYVRKPETVVPTTIVRTVGGNAGRANPTAIWDPYAEVYTRPIGMNPFSAKTDVVLDAAVATPPPGYALRLKTPGTTYLSVGPPASAGRLTAAESQSRLRTAIRSMARYLEAQARVEGNVPYLTFPAKVPWREHLANFQGEPRFVGWHVFEIENAAGKRMSIPLPDHRYVRPQDEGAYEREMRDRVTWFLDGKTVDGASSAHRATAKTVRLTVPLPRGVTVAAYWSGGGLVAEGASNGGSPATNGRQAQEALREILTRAYAAGGRAGPWIRGVVDYPGGSYDIPLGFQEFGIESASARAGEDPQARLKWVQEEVATGFTEPNRGVTTFVTPRRTTTRLPSRPTS